MYKLLYFITSVIANFINMDYNDIIIFKTNKEEKAKLQAEADRLRINLSSLVRYKLFADAI